MMSSHPTSAGHLRSPCSLFSSVWWGTIILTSRSCFENKQDKVYELLSPTEGPRTLSRTQQDADVTAHRTSLRDVASVSLSDISPPLLLCHTLGLFVVHLGCSYSLVPGHPTIVLALTNTFSPHFHKGTNINQQCVAHSPAQKPSRCPCPLPLGIEYCQ